MNRLAGARQELAASRCGRPGHGGTSGRTLVNTSWPCASGMRKITQTALAHVARKSERHLTD